MTTYGNTGHGHHHRPQLKQGHRPRHGPQQQQFRPNVTMALVTVQATRSVWSQRQQDPQTPTWSQVAVQTRDIHIAAGGNRNHGYQFRPCYSRIMDPDTALGSGLGLADTMVLCGSAGHPDQQGPCGGRDLRHQHDHRFRPRSGAFLWPLVLSWATDINTDLVYV
ncbi:hypothetical protein I79_024848 [Cricetulus griseus]|uniref:Uncharacterized protein n=1 Tax=Cricetulus griseus TaxID=10029 RepID=G3ILS6_CRIGR|nr:hypothetical protein I79_024848 [Cricetulus griseus]